jgi:hypothetical protein
MEGGVNASPLHPRVPGEIRRHAAEAKEVPLPQNVLRQLMEDLDERLREFPELYEEEAVSPERREQAVRAVGAAAVGYLRQRIRHERAYVDPQTAGNTAGDRQFLQEAAMAADRARRGAHIALCDAIEIAARSILRPTVTERQPPAEVGELLRMRRKLDDGTYDGIYREHVGDLAVAYVFSLLRERGLGAASTQEK